MKYIFVAFQGRSIVGWDFLFEVMCRSTSMYEANWRLLYISWRLFFEEKLTSSSKIEKISSKHFQNHMGHLKDKAC